MPLLLPARERWTAASTLAEALKRAQGLTVGLAVVEAALLEQPAAKDQLAQLKKQQGEMPVVLLARKETAAKLMELAASVGVDDCLLSPLEPDALRLRLDSLGREPTLRPTRRFPRTVLLVEQKRGAGNLAAALSANGFLVRTVEARSQGPLAVANIDLVLLVPPYAESPQLVLTRLERDPLCQRAQKAVVLPEGETWASRDSVAIWPENLLQQVDELMSRMDTLLHRPPNRLRVSERVPFHYPVEFRESGNGPWRSGYSADLSPGGIFLRTLVPERSGACVDIRIHLTATRETFDGTGVVAWSNLPTQRKGWANSISGMGVEFLGMSPRQLGCLRQLCQRVSG